MSLYAEYIKEREGKNIVESDIGFATYYFLGEGCYLQDIYVKPEFRKTGECNRLADEVSKIAKEQGCKKLYGSVVPSANGSMSGLKACLAYGMKLDSCINNFIAFSKDL